MLFILDWLLLVNIPPLLFLKQHFSSAGAQSGPISWSVASMVPTVLSGLRGGDVHSSLQEGSSVPAAVGGVMLPHGGAVQMRGVMPSLTVVILYPHEVGHRPTMVCRSLADTPWCVWLPCCFLLFSETKLPLCGQPCQHSFFRRTWVCELNVQGVARPGWNCLVLWSRSKA